MKHQPPPARIPSPPSDQVLCSHVVVSMSAAAAAHTFPEAAFRSHRRTTGTPGGGGSPGPNGGTNRGGGGGERTNAAILRATGDVLVPEALARHVEFVSGLTELWVPNARHGELDGAGEGRFGGLFGGIEVGLDCRLWVWRVSHSATKESDRGGRVPGQSSVPRRRRGVAAQTRKTNSGQCEGGLICVNLQNKKPCFELWWAEGGQVLKEEET